MIDQRGVLSPCKTRLSRVLAALIVGSIVTLQAYSVFAATLEEVKSVGAVIAIANEPPWTQLAPDGSPAGIGPELDKAILSEVGVTKFSAQVMEYGAMIPALQSKRVTLSSSGSLMIKPERCQAVIFSNPVNCGAEALIVPVALVGKVNSYEDVANQGLKIGVCGGCTQQKLAIEAEVKADNIVIFPDGTSGMKLLADKRVDLLGHDISSATDLQERLSNPAVTQVVRAAGTKLSCAGAAFNKDSVELRDAYNEGLRRIMANGKYMEILKKYGKETAAVDVDKTTMEQHCTK